MRISSLYYRRWKKVVAKVDGIQEKKELFPYNTTGLFHKVHEDPKSMLTEIKPKLKAYILNLCKKGIQLTNWMVQREASWLLPVFKDKLQQSKELVIQCFTGLTQHCAMHTVQKHFLETVANTKDFMAIMRDEVDGRNPDDIINMNQTPITFLYYSNTMLDVKETNTIPTRTSMSDKEHVTFAATITASGNMLPPHLIFKGKPNGCSASQEFLTFHAVGKYACQDKAWVDEGRCMHVLMLFCICGRKCKI